jgi:putative glycosyltransferase (TIGR04372 family)
MVLRKIVWLALSSVFTSVSRVCFEKVKFRIVVIYASRVGPLIMVPELARISRKYINENDKVIVIDFFIIYYRYPKSKVKFQTMLKYWRRRSLFLPSCLLPKDSGPEWLNLYFSKLVFRQDPTDDTENGPKLINYSPHSTLHKYKSRKKRQILTEYGVRENEKYVCILVRDDNYLTKMYPNIDWSHHDFRDHNVQLFIPTISYLIDCGYKVFRMGNLPKEATNFNHPMFFDYACDSNSSLLSDFVLWTNCSFAISTSSGIDSLASLNRRPLGLIDLVPVNHPMNSAITILSYRKHFFDNRYLNKEEIINLGLGQAFDGDDYKKKEVTLELSSSSEILECIKVFERNTRLKNFLL